MRYFFSIDTQPDSDTYMQPLSLYRFEVRDTSVLTERWTGSGWEHWPDLIAFTGIGGADDFMETTAEEASKFQDTKRP